jgi:hypothetical protein
LSAFRLGKQPLRGIVAEEQSLDAHVWIPFLQAGQAFRENLLSLAVAQGTLLVGETNGSLPGAGIAAASL